MTIRHEMLIQMMEQLTEYLEEQGLDTELFLSSNSFEGVNLHNLDEFSVHCLYALLMTYASDLLGDQHLGLHYGSIQYPGFIQQIRVRCVDTLMTLENVQAFMPTVDFTIRKHSARESAELVWHHQNTLGSHHLVEDSMARWLWLSRRLIGMDVQPLKLKLAFESLGKTDDLDDYFQCDIDYECHENVLEIPVKVLESTVNLNRTHQLQEFLWPSIKTVLCH